MNAADLFFPWDIEVALENFDATCGPAAFAAFTRSEVCRVMQHFPDPFPGYCNGRTMMAAMDSAGVLYRKAWGEWPKRGLCWLLITGPWSEPNVPIGAQLRHSHWIAIEGEYVFDINATEWMTRADWERDIMRGLLIAETKRATGFKPRLGLEVP